MMNNDSTVTNSIVFPETTTSSTLQMPTAFTTAAAANTTKTDTATKLVQPKKNLTSYVLFSNHIRPIIKSNVPGISFADLSKQMGLEYRNLSSEQKEYWIRKAKEDKIRYSIEIEEYRKNMNALAISGGYASYDALNNTGGSGDASASKPAKKGKSSYNLYFKAMNDKAKLENPGITFGELSKKLALEFKSLSQEERRRWDELAKLDRKRVRDEQQHANRMLLGASPSEATAGSGYDQNHTYSTPSFLQQVDSSLNLDKLNKPSSASTNAITMKLNNKKQRNQLKDPKIPKKNVTAYIHFCNDKRKALKLQHPTANICELGKILGLEYKKITPADRIKFDDMAKEDKRRYDAAMLAYQAEIDIEKEEINLLSLFRARPP